MTGKIPKSVRVGVHARGHRFGAGDPSSGLRGDVAAEALLEEGDDGGLLGLEVG